MIITEPKETIIKNNIPVKIICDRCMCEIDYDKDVWEYQEAFIIRKVGGYGSVFGDGSTVEADLCQRCLRDIIKDFCRVDGEPYVTNP